MRRAAANGGRCVVCLLLLALVLAAAAVASASSCIHTRLPVVCVSTEAMTWCLAGVCAKPTSVVSILFNLRPNHPQVPVDARRRAQEHSRHSSRHPNGLVHARQASHLPVAMLGGIVEGIGNSIRRLKEGTADLMGNAKQLGSLKYVRPVGYVRRQIGRYVDVPLY